MAAKSNYLENKLIDHIYRGVPYNAPGTIYIALFTAAPSAAGGGTEVAGGSYARPSLTTTAANWAATNGAGSATSPSSGTSGQTSNNAPIAFATTTAAWGTIVAFATFDASTGGNMLHFGSITPATVGSGVTPSLASGQLTIAEN